MDQIPLGPRQRPCKTSWGKIARSNLNLGIAVCVAASLGGWQLFVPPIVGLADQGDFVRLIGPFGYAPVPKGAEHKYSFLTRRFVKDNTYRAAAWEQTTSEFLFVGLAFGINRLLGHGSTFDITVIGAVHFVAFLAAFTRLLFVTRFLQLYRIIWVLATFILTDVAYVAYWNSFYSEPSSCIWFLFLLAETVAICAQAKLSTRSVLCWTIFAVLLISAKTQNAPLALALSIFLARLTLRSLNWLIRAIGLGCSAMILVTGLWMYISLNPAPRLVTVYNLLFLSVLPESHDPAADLKILGLPQSLIRYTGTLAWAPDSGLLDPRVVDELQRKCSPIKLATFYLVRPKRLWRHCKLIFPKAFSLRPEFCGNYEASAGRPPGALSSSFSFWSSIHQRVLANNGKFIFLALLFLVVPICHFWRSSGEVATNACEAIICLISLTVTAFLTAAFDSWDITKHFLQFNLLLDTVLALLVIYSIPIPRLIRLIALKGGARTS